VILQSARWNPDNEGRLIHVSGELLGAASALDSEFDFGGRGPEEPPPYEAEPSTDARIWPSQQASSHLCISREVQNYMWTESSQSQTTNELGGSKVTKTVHTYRKEWADGAPNSQAFAQADGHHNPSALMASETAYATGLRLGEFEFQSPKSMHTLLTSAATLFHPTALRLRSRQMAVERFDNDWYFIASCGSRLRPELGDTRVKFKVCTSPMTVTIVGVQRGQIIAASDEVGLIAKRGECSLESMVASQRLGNQGMKWILRVVGSLVQFAGWKTALDPVVTAAVIIPFVSNLVGVGTTVVAVPSTVALSLLSIALGYINARIDFLVVNYGLKGVWVLCAYKMLKLIFGYAARTVRSGASTVGSAVKSVGGSVFGGR